MEVKSHSNTDIVHAGALTAPHKMSWYYHLYLARLVCYEGNFHRLCEFQQVQTKKMFQDVDKPWWYMCNLWYSTILKLRKDDRNSLSPMRSAHQLPSLTLRVHACLYYQGKGTAGSSKDLRDPIIKVSVRPRTRCPCLSLLGLWRWLHSSCEIVETANWSGAIIRPTRGLGK